MKNKKSGLLLIVFANLISKSIYLSASNPTGIKQLKINDTTLEFKEVIYVDGTNGNDQTGDGTSDKPFTTIVKGFDDMNEHCR